MGIVTWDWQIPEVLAAYDGFNLPQHTGHVLAAAAKSKCHTRTLRDLATQAPVQSKVATTASATASAFHSRTTSRTVSIPASDNSVSSARAGIARVF